MTSQAHDEAFNAGVEASIDVIENSAWADGSTEIMNGIVEAIRALKRPVGVGDWNAAIEAAAMLNLGYLTYEERQNVSQSIRRLLRPATPSPADARLLSDDKLEQLFADLRVPMQVIEHIRAQATSLQAMTAERDAAIVARQSYINDFVQIGLARDEYFAQLTAAQQRLGEMREALQIYGEHSQKCSDDPRSKCICGLDDTLKALAAPPANGDVG